MLRREFKKILRGNLRNARTIAVRVLRPCIHPIRDIQESRRIQRNLNFRFPNLKLGEKSTVVDLGLNRGRFTLAVANSGARVIAVEPNPHVFKKAVKILSKYNNVEFIQAAIQKSTGPCFLYFHKDFEDDPIGHSISASTIDTKFNIDLNKKVGVIGLGINVIFECLEEITLLKVDIEGGEIMLVDTIINNYQRIEYLLMETHEDRISEGKNELQKLRDFIDEKNLSSKWDLSWE